MPEPTTILVPETAPPRLRHQKGTFYHPELDVLRFVAFFLVFIAHLNFAVFDPVWPRHMFVANLTFAIGRAGSSGVTLFFTLSSFLITELLLREQTQTGTIHIRDFYIRRILRIWPLYFFFLLIFRPLFAKAFSWEHFTDEYLLAFLLLAGNWIFVTKGVAGSVADPLWSISIEEQYYLVWPLVVSRWRNRLPEIAYGMLLLSNIARVYMLIYPSGDMGIWCNTLARLDPFALGALAAFYLHERELKMSRTSRLFLMVFSILILLGTGRYGDHTNDRAPLTYPLEAMACLGLLLAVLLPLASWQPGIVGKPLIYLGKISYGLYVFHIVFIKIAFIQRWNFFTGNAVALLLTIATAAISYALLEKPFLRLKHRFTYVKSRF